MRTTRLILVAAIAALALAAPAGAQLVSVGQSGWAWSSPQPQGNTLLAMEFSGGVGYAAGDFGTVLRTTDGGATWQGLPTGITLGLNRVRLIDADSIVIGGGCLVRRSDDGGRTFVRVPWTPSELRCGAAVSSLSFPSSDVGYLALSDGTVMRTADGGRTWSRKTSVPTTQSAPGGGSSTPTDVVFVSADTGFVTVRGGSGQIYRTTDAGASWSPVGPGGTPSLRSLSFVTATLAFATGDRGTLLRSTDGGVTWAAVTTLPPQAADKDLTSLRAADENLMLVTEAKGGTLFRTTDGGATWTPVSPSTQAIFAAAFADTSKAIGVGQAGATVLSSNGGETWTGVSRAVPGPFTGLVAMSATSAVATGPNGALARTLDGGRTWATLGASTPDDIRAAAFPSERIGYALDTAGTLLRTTDGGAAWAVLDHGSPSEPLDLLAPTDDRVVVVHRSGARYSTDGGATFKAGKGFRRARLRKLDVAGGSVLAWGDKVLYLSRDAGRTWRKTRRSPVTKRRIHDADFGSATRGFVLSNDGRVWITRNGGTTWSESLGVGTNLAYTLAAGDGSNAWVGLTRPGDELGSVLHTSDGGATWRPQRIPGFAPHLTAAGTSAFIATPNSELLVTSTGGDHGDATRLTLRSPRRSISPSALRRAGNRIRVTGRLSPARGGELVAISMRSGGSWRSQVVQASESGSFTTTWTVRRGAAWVAQYAGDSTRRGAGSKVLELAVR